MSQDVASAAPASTDGDDPLRLLRQRFEQLLRDGAKPRIEDFLQQAPEALQYELLCDLITLELQILRSPGETFDCHGYYRRFPQYSAMLDALIGKWLTPGPALNDPEFLPPGPKQLDTVVFSSVPMKFKQFELRSIIGEGSFGVVWRAWDTRLQRDVAIKFPRSDALADADKSLFVREARVVARLRHPHIVAVYEVEQNEENVYFVAELIDGQSLKNVLGAKKFSDTETALLLSKIAAALEHAHSQGVVHRDLKPANILIDAHGDPHITDFGLAKREVAEESLSIPGKIMGTPVYMSPEQARGDHGATDRRTDIYSMGVMLYELLTGNPPFRGELNMLLQQICTLAPVPPRTVRSDVPKDLEAICLKCLEKDPEKRYATAQALADDLHLYLGGQTLRGIPPTITNRVSKWLYRNRRFLGVLTGVAVCAGMGAAMLQPVIFPPPPPAPAPFVQTVEFLTEPEGCEVIVYAIDPATGEPDFQTKKQAPGKTPLQMQLEPGDYFVVATLEVPQFKDERFHEVYRHVPELDEGATGNHTHEHSTKKANGVIVLPTIKIPPLDFESGMGLAGGDNLGLLSPSKAIPDETWFVPPFYVELEERKGLETHSLAVAAAEQAGMRLPFAAEICFLCKVACPGPHKVEDEPEQQLENGGCALPNGKVIRGLHSNPWEWTSSCLGASGSGTRKAAKGSVRRMLSTLRIAGGGDPSTDVNMLPLTGMILQPESLPVVPMSARFVRSKQPRRTPEDFVMPATITAGN